MAVGTGVGEKARQSGALKTKVLAKGSTPFDATIRSHESLLIGNALETAKKLLRYHLPVADVANLTGLPVNSVSGIRRALAAIDGRHTVMGIAGRPPHSFITMVLSPDTHIVMSGFAVAFYSAYKARGDKTIAGEDVLRAMDFCKNLGANLNDAVTTRRMLLVAQCLQSGEGEIATCKCCRTRFVRASSPQFVPSRPEPLRGNCPFCAKARSHYGETNSGAKPAEEF